MLLMAQRPALSQSPPQRHAVRMAPAASLSLNIHYVTEYGQNLYLCGSTPELGSWDVRKMVPLSWTPDHVWKIELKLAPGPVEYKYILQTGGTIRWEDGNNHSVILQPKSRVCITDFWQEGPQHRLILALSPVMNMPKVASLLRLHKAELLDDREDE